MLYNSPLYKHKIISIFNFILKAGQNATGRQKTVSNVANFVTATIKKHSELAMPTHFSNNNAT